MAQDRQHRLDMLDAAMEHCLQMQMQMIQMMQDLLHDDSNDAEMEEYQHRQREEEYQHTTAMVIRHAAARHRVVPYLLPSQRLRSSRFWVLPTSQEWWDVFVMNVWDSERWLRSFRMTSQTFFEIVDILRPHLQRQTTHMRRPVPVEKRLAATLYFLANSVSYRVVAQQFGLGETTTAEIVVEVCLTIEVTLLQSTVCLGDHRKIMDGFAAMGMPQTIGAVDGTYIPLVNHKGRCSRSSNRTSSSSILLQAVADHTLRFIHVEIGRNHDAFLFSNSTIYSAMDRGEFVPGNPTIPVGRVQVPPLILGDGGYPMDRWLMKAYTGARLSARERHFNKAFKRCHNVVEQAFGHLKMRWKCLSARLWVAEENVVPIISACVVLHNICEEKGHPLPPEDPPHPEPSTSHEPNAPEAAAAETSRQQAGKRVRDALAAHMYAHRR